MRIGKKMWFCDTYKNYIYQNRKSFQNESTAHTEVILQKITILERKNMRLMIHVITH